MVYKSKLCPRANGMYKNLYVETYATHLNLLFLSHVVAIIWLSLWFLFIHRYTKQPKLTKEEEKKLRFMPEATKTKQCVTHYRSILNTDLSQCIRYAVKTASSLRYIAVMLPHKCTGKCAAQAKTDTSTLITTKLPGRGKENVATNK